MVDIDEPDRGGGFLRRLPGRLWKMMRWRILITLIIVIGVYNAASSLEVDRAYVSAVYPEGIEGTYTVTFSITVDNPTGTTIEVDLLTYDLHLEEDKLGKGEKAFFDIPPGKMDLDFELTFSIYDLAGPTVTLFTEDSATLRISGEVTVPAKVFGLWTYTHITVPYSEEEEISSGGGGNGNDPPPHQVLLGPPIYRPTASADLTWSMNTDADFAKYEVHTSTTADFTPSGATLAGTVQQQGTTSFTVGGLSHLSTHYFLVRVLDDAGQSADSNRVSIFIP
jgi:LEA14-like dessication related protein